MWKLPFVSRKKYQDAMRAWASCAETMGELMDLCNDDARALAATHRDLRECQEANADLRADLDAARARIAELSSPDTVTLLANAEALCGCSSELWSDAAAEVVP